MCRPLDNNTKGYKGVIIRLTLKTLLIQLAVTPPKPTILVLSGFKQFPLGLQIERPLIERFFCCDPGGFGTKE